MADPQDSRSVDELGNIFREVPRGLRPGPVVDAVKAEPTGGLLDGAIPSGFAGRCG